MGFPRPNVHTTLRPSYSMILSLLFTEPILFFALILGIVYALTIHEYAHALMAYALGDPTAERQGRLTLNPLSHLDPVGFMMLLVAGFGYAKPVPFTPAYLRDQRIGSMFVGIAGVLANLLFAIVGAFVLKIVGPMLGATNLLVQFLYLLIFINVNLAVFNLIPIPPLDGSKVLFTVLHGPRWDRLKFTLSTQGPFILIMLILADNIGGIGIISGILRFFANSFYSLVGLDLVL